MGSSQAAGLMAISALLSAIAARQMSLIDEGDDDGAA